MASLTQTGLAYSRHVTLQQSPQFFFFQFHTKTTTTTTAEAYTHAAQRRAFIMWVMQRLYFLPMFVIWYSSFRPCFPAFDACVRTADNKTNKARVCVHIQMYAKCCMTNGPLQIKCIVNTGLGIQIEHGIQTQAFHDMFALAIKHFSSRLITIMPHVRPNIYLNHRAAFITILHTAGWCWYESINRNIMQKNDRLT